MMASCVVRVAFDAVHVKRNFAGKPLQVQKLLLDCEGADGPPVQFALRSASAFVGL